MSARKKKLHKGISDAVQRSHQTSRSLSRATGIHSATMNYSRPRSVVLTIVWQAGELLARNNATSSDVATTKFLITRNPGVVIDARPRSHICNFSTMQRGASWPSNLNLRFARYHRRVRSSEDLSKYQIAESSPIWSRWTTIVSIRCNTWFVFAVVKCILRFTA